MYVTLHPCPARSEPSGLLQIIVIDMGTVRLAGCVIIKFNGVCDHPMFSSFGRLGCYPFPKSPDQIAIPCVLVPLGRRQQGPELFGDLHGGLPEVKELGCNESVFPADVMRLVAFIVNCAGRNPPLSVLAVPDVVATTSDCRFR